MKARSHWVQGYLTDEKTPTTLGPPEDPGHGSTVGSKQVPVFGVCDSGFRELS